MSRLVTKLEDVEEWQIFSGEVYKRSQFKWKRLISEELCGSGDMTLGLGELDPGKVHGIHRHPHADEIYYVLKGVAKVILGDEEIVADPGTAIYIPKGTNHGIVNQSDRPFVLLWVTKGQIRLEDY